MRPLLPVFRHPQQFIFKTIIDLKMKLSILFTLPPFALPSHANPEPLVGSLTVGLAPFEEPKPYMKLFTANRVALGNFSSKAQASACGVYFFENPNFTNNCYWGCYPLGIVIYPDTYTRSSESAQFAWILESEWLVISEFPISQIL